MSDYTDLELVKNQLSLEEDFSSTTIPSNIAVGNWIEEASAEIENRTGLTYSSEVFSDEIFDWEGNDSLLRTPFEIVSISSLYYNSQAAGETPVWTLKTADEDFFVYGDSEEIEFNNRKFKPLPGRKRFKISGLKGKSEVPIMIQRLATLMVANRVVEATIQNQAYANSGGDVQVGTIKVGNPSSFSVSAVNNSKAEIESIFNKVLGDFRSFRITRAYDL